LSEIFICRYNTIPTTTRGVKSYGTKNKNIKRIPSGEKPLIEVNLVEVPHVFFPTIAAAHLRYYNLRLCQPT
jgi:hypothetical protein